MTISRMCGPHAEIHDGARYDGPTHLHGLVRRIDDVLDHGRQPRFVLFGVEHVGISFMISAVELRHHIALVVVAK